MRLVGFRHKRLRQLYAEDNAKGVSSATADNWRLHPLKGNLKGLWSLTVTGNWRLIFRYDQDANSARDIDLIDYH